VQVREIKGALSERTLESWSGWKMIVVDANEKSVFEIDFDLRLIPIQSWLPSKSLHKGDERRAGD
jgi:hypothetical protein